MQSESRHFPRLSATTRPANPAVTEDDAQKPQHNFKAGVEGVLNVRSATKGGSNTSAPLRRLVAAAEGEATEARALFLSANKQVLKLSRVQ